MKMVLPVLAAGIVTVFDVGRQVGLGFAEVVHGILVPPAFVAAVAGASPLHNGEDNLGGFWGWMFWVASHIRCATCR